MVPPPYKKCQIFAPKKLCLHSTFFKLFDEWDFFLSINRKINNPAKVFRKHSAKTCQPSTSTKNFHIFNKIKTKTDSRQHEAQLTLSLSLLLSTDMYDWFIHSYSGIPRVKWPRRLLYELAFLKLYYLPMFCMSGLNKFSVSPQLNYRKDDNMKWW